MSGDIAAGSGRRNTFVPYETRKIVLAEGVQFHDTDARSREAWRSGQISALEANPASFRSDQQSLGLVEHFGFLDQGMTDAEAGTELLTILKGWQPVPANLEFLEQNIGADFQVAGDRKSARYVNNQQQVTYEISVIQKRTEFKAALETEGIIVVYIGHSRYGRGACFDHYSGAYTEHGEFWGDGTTADNGIFRLAFPYVPVPLSDIAHHQYHFAPVAVESPRPSRSGWSRHPKNMHPEGRRRFTSILLPENLRPQVKPQFASPSHRYWGFTKRGVTSVLLISGWNGTAAAPADLGATELKCRTICHFGCSSRKHYWDILRRPQYKGYQRPRPPTEKFVYLTTAPSNYKTFYWLYYLLSYNRANGPTHWWDSHEYAKAMTNRRLRRERMGFQIF